MRVTKPFVLTCSLLLGFNETPVFSWGQIGHRTIAKIAEHHLTPNAARKLKRLLGNESLPRAATWMDEVRLDPDHTRFDPMRPWHYVEIPDDKTYETSNKNPSGDAIQAVQTAEKTLKDRLATVDQKILAVRVLTHVVGELHCPVHVGNGKDHGSNWCYVLYLGQPTTLHRMWDDHLIQALELSYTEFAAFIDFPTPQEIRKWQNSTPIDWAEESRAIRRTLYPKPLTEGASYAYCKTSEEEDIPQKKMPKLGYEYVYMNKGIVEQRLLQAGIRLAGILNAALR